MASAGENLNASQFYITLRVDLDFLDGNHTVFVKVVEGLETLERINGAYVDQDNRNIRLMLTTSTGTVNVDYKPFKNIRIKHTYVLDDPFYDPPQLSIQDIPEAGVKPPENVLFVCKLNPVTEGEDLHTIFSRFGTVSSAEIIRDYKTGDGLCYAFIDLHYKVYLYTGLAVMCILNFNFGESEHPFSFSRNESQLVSAYDGGLGSDGEPTT